VAGPLKRDPFVREEDTGLRDQKLTSFQQAVLEPGSKSSLNSVIRCYSTFNRSAGVPASLLTYRSLAS